MRADITVEPGGRGTLKLDGHDIAAGVLGFTLDASVGQITRLELDLSVFEGTVSGEVEVIVPDSTRDLLVRLGWTPPAD